MLQDIRDRAQGWIAWLIVFLISIPFALWGIQSYLGGSANSDVASIDGEGVSKNAFLQTLEQVRTELPAQIPDDFVKELALQRLVLRQLILAAIKKDNYQISDQEIQKIISTTPEFQQEDRFNYQHYKQILASVGLVEHQYESQLRTNALLSQFNLGYESSAFVTQPELSNYLRLSQQVRDFDYVQIKAESFADQVELTEEVLQAFYNLKKSTFLGKEQVKLEYVALHRNDIKQTIDATEEQLQAIFEAESSQLTPEEERKTSHIFILVNDQVPEKVAKQKADDIRARIIAGEDFAALAKDLSDDASGQQGGTLGYLSKDDDTQDPVFLDMVFRLEKDTVSDVVRSAFGYHLIKVTEINEATVTFDSARPQLLNIYREQEVSQVFDDLIQLLEEVSYDNATSLQPTAEAVGFPLKETDWLTQQGGDTPVTSSEDILEKAFQTDMTMRKENSQIINISPDHVAIIRVIDHKEVQPMPYEQVKEQIKEQILQQKTTDLATELGVKLKQQLDDGKTLSDIATENDLVIEVMTDIDRKSLDVPGGIRDEAFRMFTDESNLSAAQSVAILTSGDYALIELNDIRNADVQPEMMEFYKESLAKEMAKGELKRVLENLRTNIEIQIFKENL